MNTYVTGNTIKELREARKLTQAELAERSGVSLRSIQMYEQKVNDIDKAQGHTLYKISRVKTPLSKTKILLSGALSGLFIPLYSQQH